VAAVASRIHEMVRDISPLLHESDAPRIVDVTRRHQECPECGFLAAHRGDSHTCPWPAVAMQRHHALGQRTVQRPLARSATPASGRPPPAVVPRAPAAASGAPSRPSAPLLPSAPSDGMCKQWRKSKTCPTQASGRRCNGQHPPDYVVPAKHCFDFLNGKCNRGAECKFAHIAQPSPAPAVEGAAAGASPPLHPDAPTVAAGASVVPAHDNSWETAGRPPSPAPAATSDLAATSGTATASARPATPPPSSSMEWTTTPATVTGRKGRSS
jgi:hypothetical protein